MNIVKARLDIAAVGGGRHLCIILLGWGGMLLLAIDSATACYPCWSCGKNCLTKSAFLTLLSSKNECCPQFWSLMPNFGWQEMKQGDYVLGFGWAKRERGTTLLTLLTNGRFLSSDGTLPRVS